MGNIKKITTNYVYATSVVGTCLYVFTITIVLRGELESIGVWHSSLILLPMLVYAVIIHVVSKFISEKTLVTSVNVALSLATIRTILFIGWVSLLVPSDSALWILTIPATFSFITLEIFILSCLIIGIMKKLDNYRATKNNKSPIIRRNVIFLAFLVVMTGVPDVLLILSPITIISRISILEILVSLCIFAFITIAFYCRPRY